MAGTMRRSDGALQRLLSDPVIRVPLLRRESARLAALVLTALLFLPLSSCTFPQDEDEVPEVEWVVWSVRYFPHSTPSVLMVVFQPDEYVSSYEYYDSFDLSTRMDFTKIISVPGIDEMSSFSLHSISIDFYPGETTIPPGSIATFHDTAFYQVDSDNVYGRREVVGKVRIVTPSMEITVIE